MASRRLLESGPLKVYPPNGSSAKQARHSPVSATGAAVAEQTTPRASPAASAPAGPPRPGRVPCRAPSPLCGGDAPPCRRDGRADSAGAGRWARRNEWRRHGRGRIPALSEGRAGPSMRVGLRAAHRGGWCCGGLPAEPCGAGRVGQSQPAGAEGPAAGFRGRLPGATRPAPPWWCGAWWCGAAGVGFSRPVYRAVWMLSHATTCAAIWVHDYEGRRCTLVN